MIAEDVAIGKYILRDEIESLPREQKVVNPKLPKNLL